MRTVADFSGGSNNYMYFKCIIFIKTSIHLLQNMYVCISFWGGGIQTTPINLQLTKDKPICFKNNKIMI